jgi:hypothetical protein
MDYLAVIGTINWQRWLQISNRENEMLRCGENLRVCGFRVP